MLFYKGEKTKDISINGSFHGDDESTICIAASDVIDKSADNAILILEKEQYAQRDQMLIHPKIGEISYLKNFRGELDLTLNKDSITSNNTGYQLLRGRNIGYYSLVDTSKKNMLMLVSSKKPQNVNISKVRVWLANRLLTLLKNEE